MVRQRQENKVDAIIDDATIKLCKSKLEQCKPIYETMKPKPARFKDTQSDKLFIKQHLT